MCALRSKSKGRVGVGPLTSNSWERSVTDKEMCKAFNEYFSTVFTIEDTHNIPNVQRLFSGTKEKELSDFIITQEIVAGADELSTRYLKEVQVEICIPLLESVPEIITGKQRSGQLEVCKRIPYFQEREEERSE